MGTRGLLVDSEIENYERELVEASDRGSRPPRAGPAGVWRRPQGTGWEKGIKWAETEADFPLRTVRQRSLTTGAFTCRQSNAVGWHPDYAAHTPPPARTTT